MSTSANDAVHPLCAPLWAIALLVALALAVGLRLAALSGEFWFDEIWSWEFARDAGSPWAILFELRHDNSHKLNTLYLYYCPDNVPLIWYRLHALLAGIAAVALAALAAWRWGAREAVFAALLLASNYWLVLLSAEARGYTMAVVFALLAFLSLRRWLEQGGTWLLVVFWLVVVLGFLAHLTFLHCYLGLFLWSLRHFAQRGRGVGEQLVPLVKCHAVPGGFFVLLYFVDVSRMELGGAPPTSLWAVLARLVGLGLGGPAGGWAVLPWALFAAFVFGYGLVRMARAGDSAWVFFAVVVVGAPTLLLLKAPPYLFERYFLIPCAFFLLLLSYVLGAVFRRGWLGRGVAGGALLAVVAGGVWHVADFAEQGRGQFHKAFAYIAEHDDAPTVTVTGDNDFRIAKYCRFYGPRVSDRPVVYRSAKTTALLAGSATIGLMRPGRQVCNGLVAVAVAETVIKRNATWLLVHRMDDQHPPGEIEEDQCGNRYRLMQSYPSRGIGCWGCFVYRRQGS
jgi:hypothetical protein